MITFGYPNDRFDHIWEAAATATTLSEPVIHLGWHDEVPGILIEQGNDRLFDLHFRDDVAVTD